MLHFFFVGQILYEPLFGNAFLSEQCALLFQLVALISHILRRFNKLLLLLPDFDVDAFIFLYFQPQFLLNDVHICPQFLHLRTLIAAEERSDQ